MTSTVRFHELKRTNQIECDTDVKASAKFKALINQNHNSTPDWAMVSVETDISSKFT